MNETVVCVVGNVATRPVYRELSAGPSARFRLAVTSRYWDREKSAWTDGHTNFFTVWANRQLAVNVAASVEVGQPVVVQGRLKVRSEVREGQQNWASADIDAVAIGHDLARGTALFRRAALPEALGGGPARPRRGAAPRPHPRRAPAGAAGGATPGAELGDTVRRGKPGAELGDTTRRRPGRRSGPTAPRTSGGDVT
ncbi:single-stranded DNA-binding protein [Streptomyces diastatochromogenes]|uniref:single-stranded DNA-binding protein n=1 Tax=Streptomyces diastatochromogenes TaxID=42236 RepID=UPI00369F6896